MSNGTTASPALIAAASVGDRLRQARLDRGLSQRDLSCPGVSYAYISRIECGARQPSVKALRKLAAKLDVTVTWLETGEDMIEVPLPRQLAERIVGQDAWDDVELEFELLERIAAALGREPNYMVGVA